jgi:uncharacterized membrane protein
MSPATLARCQLGGNMLNNLAGWHLLIILGVLAIMALIAVAVIALVLHLSRKDPTNLAPTTPDPAEQIKRLAQLRDQGLLSEAEYEAKRSELLGSI